MKFANTTYAPQPTRSTAIGFPTACLALLMTGVLLVAIKAGFAGTCVPNGMYPIVEIRNEDGVEPTDYVGSNSDGRIQHATQVFQTASPITHLCVAAKSPSGGPNDIGTIFFATQGAGGLPNPPSLTFDFVIEPQAGFQLVELSTPVSVSSGMWVGVDYPTATGGIGHQGHRPRLSGQAAIWSQASGWRYYDNVGGVLAGETPSIALYSFGDCEMYLTPASGLETGEDGTDAHFEVGFDPYDEECAPMANVVVSFSSSDPSEGIPVPSQITFTPSDWGPQLVSVEGQDDALTDGDIPYTIYVTVTSADPVYDGYPLPNVGVTNIDDEAEPPIVFAPPVTYSAGNCPRSVAVGDFDRDGDADLVTINQNPDAVSILMNNGGGTFAAPVSYTVDGGSAPTKVVVADVEVDGDIDLCVTLTSGGVSVLLNAGDGTFLPSDFYSTDGPQSHVADFGWINNDADPDLVVSNATENEIAKLWGLGNGTFDAPITHSTTGNLPYGIALGRFNGDQWLDIAVANGNSSSISVFLNNGSGSGTFSDPPSTYSVRTGPFGITVGDLDGDGDVDLAVANRSSDNVSVLYNAGNGTFPSRTDFAVGDFPYRVINADLDGDLDIDLVTVNNNSDNISVLKNDGTGSFAAPQNLSTGDRPMGLAAGDLDNDGDLDLIASCETSDAVYVFMNQTGTDCDLDGTLDQNGQENTVRYSVWGSSSEIGWSWSLEGDGFYFEELFVSGIPWGRDGEGFAQVFVNSINSTCCPSIRARIDELDHRSFFITVPGDDQAFSVGDYGQAPNCNATIQTCQFNPQIFAGEPDCCTETGDINIDGIGFQVADAVQLTNYFIYQDPDLLPCVGNADINGDCVIDTTDLVDLVCIITGDCTPVDYCGNCFTYTISPPACDCVPGDADGSSSLNINDVTYLVNHIFMAGPAPTPYALCSGDAGCDCRVDIDDIVYLIAYIFLFGPAPCDCSEWLLTCGEPLRSGGYGQDLDPQDLLWEPFGGKSAPLLKCSPHSAIVKVFQSGDGNSAASVAIDSDAPIAGVQLEFALNSSVVPQITLSKTDRSRNLELFYGLVDNVFRVGLIDLSGKHSISPGEGPVITLEFTDGSYEDIDLTEAMLSDRSALPVAVTIEQAMRQAGVPVGFSLSQNYPNPFNPATEIAFSLPQGSHVTLDVFNIRGQKVATLADGEMPAGNHTVTWNGRMLDGEPAASGVYFYKINAGGVTETRKMVLIK